MSMNTDEEASELMLGNWDESKYTGPMKWHKVEHKLFWSIALDDVKIDGKSLGLCGGFSGKKCLFTPDSGTSLITMPGWAFRQFSSEHGKRAACSVGDEYGFGDMTFTINGVDYDIPSHHWMERDVSRDHKQGYCQTYISQLDVGQKGLDNLFIAGDMFMQKFYTVFDRDRDMVGMATAVHTANEQVYHWDAKGEVAYSDFLAP